MSLTRHSPNIGAFCTTRLLRMAESKQLPAPPSLQKNGLLGIDLKPAGIVTAAKQRSRPDPLVRGSTTICFVRSPFLALIRQSRPVGLVQLHPHVRSENVRLLPVRSRRAAPAQHDVSRRQGRNAEGVSRPT